MHIVEGKNAGRVKTYLRARRKHRRCTETSLESGRIEEKFSAKE
jgi:hypothetical protein